MSYPQLIIAGVIIAIALFFLKRKKDKEKKTADEYYFNRNLQEQKDKAKNFTVVAARNAVKFFKTKAPKKFDDRGDLEVWYQDKLITALIETKNFQDLYLIFDGFEKDKDEKMWNQIKAKIPDILNKMELFVGKEIARLVAAGSSELTPVIKDFHYQSAITVSRFICLGLFDSPTTTRLNESVSSVKKVFKGEPEKAR